MQDDLFGHSRQRNRIVLTCAAIGALYWLTQSCVEALILRDNGLLVSIFRPGLQHVAERAIVLSILVPIAICLQVRMLDRMIRQLKDYRTRIGVVSRVGSAFVSFDDEEAYSHALQAVLDSTCSSQGILGYISEAGDLICASMTDNVWDECDVPDKQVTFKSGSWGGLWGRALSEKKTLYSNAPARVPAGHISIERNLATPVVHKGKVIGLLHVANKPSDYGARDVALLEAVAEHIAPILHARMKADAQKEACRVAETELGELTRSHTQLEQTNQKLMEFDRMKSEFLSNISHELRTPLASVRAYSESLLEYDLPREQSESFLRIILEQSERLTSVLDDLLDLAKIEAGELTLSLEPLLVAGAAEAALESVRPLAEKKQIRLNLGKDTGTYSVTADEQRVVQVLVNLLNNAVKFTAPGGHVVLTFASVADAAGTPPRTATAATHLRMTVSDTGEGIPPEQIDRVFDKFKQVADKTKGKRGGTGLGLTICRELVGLMGGSIWVESTVGKGSSFHFTLPLADGAGRLDVESPEQAVAAKAA